MLMNNRSIQIVRVMDLGVRFLIFFLWANVGTTYLKTCTVNIPIFFTKYETWYLIFKTFSLFCNISQCGNIFTFIFATDVECLAHFRYRCLHKCAWRSLCKAPRFEHEGQCGMWMRVLSKASMFEHLVRGWWLLVDALEVRVGGGTTGAGIENGKTPVFQSALCFRSPVHSGSSSCPFPATTPAFCLSSAMLDSNPLELLRPSRLLCKLLWVWYFITRPDLPVCW